MLRFGHTVLKVSLVCLLFLITFQLSSARLSHKINNALKIKQGDVLHVQVDDTIDPKSPDVNTGDYLVARDGAIYGTTFGRVIVADKTVLQAQKLIRIALRSYVRPDEVFVSLKSEASQYVFLYFTGGEETDLQSTVRGPIPFLPGLTLRQLLSSASLRQPNLWTVTIERNGRSTFRQSLQSPVAAGVALQPNDLVVLSPTDSIQVYISGYVAKAGRIRVKSGTTLNQLIDISGGVITSLISPTIAVHDLRATVMRKGKPIILKFNSLGSTKPFILKEGDQVAISASPVIRFSVLGNVLHPGEFDERGNIDVYRALSVAGGVTKKGSLKNILVYRANQVFSINASGPETGKSRPNFTIKSGDLVYAETNLNTFYVLGSVKNPGRFIMSEDRTYYLSDALSLAGGITDQGVLRRIFVSHPIEGKRASVQEYNLDEYLRNGVASQNPIIHPGDAILFTNNKGFSLQAAGSIISLGVLLDTLIRHP